MTTAIGDRASPASPIVCFDIGARGSLQPHWHEIALRRDTSFDFYLFEPSSSGAEELRQLYRGHPHVTVVEEAIYHKDGRFDLNNAAHDTCSSLLLPNADVLSHYNIEPIFRTLRKTPVTCSRLDTVVTRLALPKPDFIKLDVQGVEFEALLGMGALLNTCLAHLVAAHLYPLYQNGTTFRDVLSFLSGFDLILRDLKPQSTFDDDLVEVNVIFAKRAALARSAAESEKLRTIAAVLGLTTSPIGAEIRAAMGMPPLAAGAARTGES